MRDCPHSQEVWSRLGLGLHREFVLLNNVSDWIKRMTNGAEEALFAAGAWWIWRWRSNMIFGDEIWSIDSVIHHIRVSQTKFANWYPSKNVIHQARDLMVHWQPPLKGSVKLNTDGSFFVSCSSMGSGGVLRSDSDEWIAGLTSFDGAGDELLAEILDIKSELNLV